MHRRQNIRTVFVVMWQFEFRSILLKCFYPFLPPFFSNIRELGGAWPAGWQAGRLAGWQTGRIGSFILLKTSTLTSMRGIFCMIGLTIELLLDINKVSGIGWISPTKTGIVGDLLQATCQKIPLLKWSSLKAYLQNPDF